MNQLQESLSGICLKDRMREKILIAPSFSAGLQIVESVVREGTHCLNLRIKTIRSLAHDLIAIDLASEAISLLPDTAMLLFVEDIFNGLKQTRNSYFQNMETKEGIVSALAGAIYDLRINGSRSSDLSSKQFESETKGKELKLMLQRYENFLKDKKYVDTAEILDRALKKIATGQISSGEQLYLALSDTPFGFLEKQLFEALPGEKTVLPHDIPLKLPFPRRYLPYRGKVEVPIPTTNIGLMPWLFDTESASASLADDTLRLFHSVGRRNEIREMLRRVLACGAKSDEVEIIYTSYEDCVPLIYVAAQKFDINMTVEEGLPVTLTRPGRAALGLISWIASDFEAVKFRHLLISGCLDMKVDDAKETSLSASTMGRIIRESGIGWKRERYLPILDAITASYEARAKTEDEDGEDRSEVYLKKVANAKYLREIIKDLFESIPIADDKGNVSVSDLSKAIMAFLERYARISNAFDGAAKFVITSQLEETAILSSQVMSLQDALNRIEMMIRDTKVGGSGPASGSLHLSSYKHGGRSGRSHTYIVGCDSQLFPGGSAQNPVLLDVELEAISTDLMLSSEQLKENLYRMASLLASLRGRVTLSFSSFDVLDNRESFPSSILLQAYRLLSGNPAANYSDLMTALGPPAGYIPSLDPIDSLDFWVKTFFTADGLKKADSSTISLYPGLSEGLKATESRQSNKVTQYDGKIVTSGGDLDPRENKNLVMSASMIEKLAACPFSYFLYYVLKVRPQDEVIAKKGEWLDPMQRGKLLHDLFYVFMKEITAKNEKPSVKSHQKLIERLAEKIIKTYKEDIPPPGEAVYEQERRQLLKTALVFLRVEEEHCRECTPLFFELAFGFGDDMQSGLGLKEPIEISIGNGKSIRLRGRIDRVDKIGDHDYEIWDYKTGSTYGHTDNGCFSGGKTVQHALYALAAEIILKKAGQDKVPNVKRSGYFFPSEKGTGKRLARGRDNKALGEVLNSLCDIIKTGLFVSSYDKSSCTYCDYAGVCDGDAVAMTNTKLENFDNTELAELRRVKDYV